MKKEYKTIEVELPKGYMNCGISDDNIFFSDTNDSSDWDTFKFPLPTPGYIWKIKTYIVSEKDSLKRTVVLIDKPEIRTEEEKRIGRYMEEDGIS